MVIPTFDESQVATLCFNLVKPKLKRELSARLAVIPPDVRKEALMRDSPLLGIVVNDTLQSSKFIITKNIIEHTRFKKGSWYQSYYPELTEKLRNETAL